MLQATAAIASLAIIMWSLGLPVMQFAQAANVTTFSNTLSDSAPSVVSNHTIEFVTPTGVAASETIVITFDQAAQAFDLTGIGEEDVDLLVGGVAETVGTDWTVAVDTVADTITITSAGAGGVIAAAAEVEILIGLHATNDGTADTQIINPATVQSYEINVTVGSADSGETRVAIVDSVTVTATVDTIFTFTVEGQTALAGAGFSTSDDPTQDSTATSIPFGELEANTPVSASQSLEVSTNAANGFVVTVAVDQQLTSSNGAVIDSFVDGGNTSVPTPWAEPNGDLGVANEAGHWGLTSNDTTLTGTLTDLYTGGTEFVAASTDPVEVFRHDGPSDGQVAGSGTAQVLYKVEITALQEAADDYTATLTYVATPVF